MKLDPFLQDLLPGFAVEAEEIAQRLQGELVDLERDLTSEQRRPVYESLARGLHTLKGTAATLGLEPLAELAHQMENLIAPFREGLRRVPTDLADALLRGIDNFVMHAKAYAMGQTDDLPSLPPLDHLVAENTPSTAAALEVAPKEVAAEEGESHGATPPSTERQTTQTHPGAHEPSEGSAKLLATPESEFEGSWRVNTGQVLALMREVERLREVRLRLDDRRRELEIALASVQRIAAQAQTAEARGLVGSVVRALGEDGDEAADVVSSLEEGLKSISTLPLRTVLDPLQRTVRDLSRRSGKEARLSVVGGEVSLDRRLLDSIKAPLVHLIRNAVDHGIEAPEGRRGRGKHREGAIVIRVEQRGNLVFIEVEDDGNGLDEARIRDEAIRRGMQPLVELQALTTSEVHQLIFHPGFSTKREVTATSGRGVGLDVVRSQVAALNGTLEVHSRPGQGTRFVMAVAAEIGSSPVLMVRCAEQFLGVPLLSIDALLTAQQALLRVGRNRVQIEYREQILQVTDLSVFLGLRPPGPVEDGKPLMIIKANGRQLALAVDEVIGDRDLMIRPLPAELRDLPAYQGAAILAQGQLMLVVRSEWLTDPGRLVNTVSSAGQRALVVDDSLTARALHRAALESGGYLVHTASDGQQGLEQLATGSYDVVICDVMMAGMDGLVFTQKLRARADLRNVPVVLVSARDTDADRRRGLAAGADAFLSKKDCASGRLLSEVSAVLARRRSA